MSRPMLLLSSPREVAGVCDERGLDEGTDGSRKVEEDVSFANEGAEVVLQHLKVNDVISRGWLRRQKDEIENV